MRALEVPPEEYDSSIASQSASIFVRGYHLFGIQIPISSVPRVGITKLFTASLNWALMLVLVRAQKRLFVHGDGIQRDIT